MVFVDAKQHEKAQNPEMNSESHMVPWVDAMHPGRFLALLLEPLEDILEEPQKQRLRAIFDYVRRLFLGEIPGYQQCDTVYHDLEHTMECGLAMSRILSGMEKTKVEYLTPELAEWGLVAVLLHDTGYIKTTEDTKGTGAKYTKVHVLRSAAFVAKHITEYGYSPRAISAIQNMIRCTGLDVDLSKINFRDEGERIMGYCLGTADLLGQMASPRYLEKLPILFLEFVEAGIEDFVDVEDLMKKTPGFFHSFVMRRFEEDFKGVYHYLEHYFPDGQNHYLLAVQRNIEKIDQILGAEDVQGANPPE